MNSRDYKTFRANQFWHVYNRGNNKQRIMLDVQDFLNLIKRFKIVLGLLKDNSLRIKPLPKDSFSVATYMLMPNHFHFIIRQNGEIQIGKLISKICNSYAKYYNNKYSHVGNVFQDIFKAKLIDSDKYLMYLSAYIHNNVHDSLDYPFSSFPDIVGTRNDNLCDKSIILSLFDNDPEKYKKFVLGFSKDQASEIEHLTFED